MATAQVSGYLPLRYVLTDTLAVRTSFDPLRTETEHSISGRAQRGMLAAALRRAGLLHELQEWVARGERIRFAPAYPRLEHGPRPLTAYPPPAYLYTPGKDADEAVDVFGPADPAAPYRAVREPVTLDRSLRADVRTTAEQYLGRSRSEEDPRGLPFLTTTLDPGQVFEARWQLRAPAPDSLHRLAERVTGVLADADGTLTLGSGGTRAHGGVRVGPADPGALLSPDRAAPAGRRRWRAGEPVDLLLLSPALLVGRAGQAAPGDLVPAVLDLLSRRLPGVRAEVGAAHVEAGLVGAYHRGYRGPMAQRWTALPGAVVRLRLDRELTTEQVRDLEAHPLGERAVDGYGQFTLLDPPPPGPAPLPPLAAPLAVRTPAAGAPADPGTDPQLADLRDTLLWNAAAPPVRDHARTLARSSARRLAPLGPGLLGRLREAVSDPRHTPGEALDALAGLLCSDQGAEDRSGPETRTVRALARARLVRPGRAPVSVRTWLEGLSEEGAAAWWEANRPDPVRSPDYRDAVAAVDLSLPDGRAPRALPGGLSDPARDWERRTAPRLCLLLVSSWLAEAAEALRDRAGGERGRR
ncbi:hypothetical protein [Nocardiopsis algeriensis]|uniref:Uncharacterized protein n=1 Tax=Nocardiopsis algeriensis TaxID=1478215 RepID=A0A841IU43_9ACTN|nr:hypothetical protein [Nocardiopsis algeriensis]